MKGAPTLRTDFLGLQQSGFGSNGAGNIRSGAEAFENFFKTYISPVHDRRGNPITVNAAFGIGAQVHTGMKGAIGEAGIAFDTDGKVLWYTKVCVAVGPGFYAGAGGSAGVGVGNIDLGASETYGAVVSGAFVPGGSLSIEANSSGAGASWGARPSIMPGVGAMCGAQKCWYEYRNLPWMSSQENK